MIFCDMTNVFVPSNDLTVSQSFFIFVISETNLTTRTFGVFCWPPRHAKRRSKRFGAKVLAAA